MTTPHEHPMPHPEFVTVTPAMARKWLASNEGNRTLRPYKVNDYVRDIQAGKWTYSNDGICLTAEGRLINGQHRLNGIVEANEPAIMLVIRNMPPEAMVAMDRGTTRTTADLLKFDGYSNSNLLGAITKLVIVIESGRIYTDSKNWRATDSEVTDFIEQYPLVEQITSYVSSIKAHIDCSPSALGAAYWLIQQVNGTSLAEHYLDQLASRENEPSGSAVLAVDSRLRSVRRDRIKPPRRDFVALLLRGWNHYATDSRVRTLPIGTRTDFRLPDVKKWQRGA